jgi:hypothetical protein
MPPLLCPHDPRLTVISARTAADLAALDLDILQRARLIASVTPETVSTSVLERLACGAINFHPGWAPSHFALYERAAEFGATVHVMVERVDAGPIDRRIEVFGGNHFGICPTVHLHRIEFRAVLPPTRQSAWSSASIESNRSSGFLIDAFS